MNPRNKSCIWAFGALVLFLVPGAFALKFEIPKELQEEVETQREAEAQERDRLLREVYGGESGAAAGAGGAGMAFDTGEAADAAADGRADTGLEPTTDRAGADPAGDFGEEEIPVFQAVAVSGSGEPAATGMIAGQVVDQESTSPVSGVAIIIEGTDIGSITDGNGNYTLGPVPSGSYTLSFVKTGYIEAKVTEFEVAAGETKTFPFALPPYPFASAHSQLEQRADELMSAGLGGLAACPRPCQLLVVRTTETRDLATPARQHRGICAALHPAPRAAVAADAEHMIQILLQNLQSLFFGAWLAIC